MREFGVHLFIREGRATRWVAASKSYKPKKSKKKSKKSKLKKLGGFFEEAFDIIEDIFD